MSVFPWIKVHAVMRHHRKTVMLDGLLGCDRSWTYVVELWMWASEHSPTGIILAPAKSRARQIARAAGWNSPNGVGPDEFYAALLTAGFVDEDETSVIIHDWDEHQTGHILKAERDAARMRRVRANKSRDGRANGSATVADSGEHSGDRLATPSLCVTRTRTLSGESGAGAAEATSTPFDEGVPDGCPPPFEGLGETEEPLLGPVSLSTLRGPQSFRRQRAKPKRDEGG